MSRRLCEVGEAVDFNLLIGGCVLSFAAPGLDIAGSWLKAAATPSLAEDFGHAPGFVGAAGLTSTGKEIGFQRSDDAWLAERIRAGEEKALSELYDRLSSMVYGLARRVVGDQSAEEIVQETFVRVWRRASTYSAARGSLNSWVLRIARNLTVDELRRRKSRVDAGRLFDEEPLDAVDPPVAGPHEEVWLEQVRQTVRRACAGLPEDQRSVLFLAYFGGLTQSEIAAELGVPLGTVKTRTRAGLWKLRELLGGRELLD